MGLTYELNKGKMFKKSGAEEWKNESRSNRKRQHKEEEEFLKVNGLEKDFAHVYSQLASCKLDDNGPQ